MSVQMIAGRLIRLAGNRKNQPTKHTPTIVTSRANIKEKKSLRLTLHVRNRDREGYFHECALLSSENGGRYETMPTNTSLASERIAKLLGLGDLIPDSEYLYLKIDEEPLKYGLMTEPAPGICVIAVSSKEARRNSITPALQRALNALHLLDTICYETDHHPSNYNVIFNERGAAVGISAFDNNGEGAFRFSRKISFKNNKGCSPLVDRNGNMNRPYLDADLVHNLATLTFSGTFAALKDCVPVASILFMWMRVTALRDAIRNSLRSGTAQLLRSEEWSEETVSEELSGQYGKTYLHSYIEDCVVPEEKLLLSPYEKCIVEAINNRSKIIGGSNQ